MLSHSFYFLFREEAGVERKVTRAPSRAAARRSTEEEDAARAAAAGASPALSLLLIPALKEVRIQMFHCAHGLDYKWNT